MKGTGNGDLGAVSLHDDSIVSRGNIDNLTKKFFDHCNWHLRQKIACQNRQRRLTIDEILKTINFTGNRFVFLRHILEVSGDYLSDSWYVYQPRSLEKLVTEPYITFKFLHPVRLN